MIPRLRLRLVRPPPLLLPPRRLHLTIPRPNQADVQPPPPSDSGYYEHIPRPINADDVVARAPTAEDLEDDEAWEDFPEFQHDDITSFGHERLAEERQYVHYMRLIEVEGPQLEKLRQPFTPLAHLPLRLRTMRYGGEAHPVTRKAVLTAPVARLGLAPAALHKFKLLAGPRWSPYPPTDAGVTPADQEAEGGEGWIKISCEHDGMQLRNEVWCSDVLDRLIQQSQINPEKFQNVPLDMRHVHVREKKFARHTHITKKDFPLEWIAPELQERAKEAGDARPLSMMRRLR